MQNRLPAVRPGAIPPRNCRQLHQRVAAVADTDRPPAYVLDHHQPGPLHLSQPRPRDPRRSGAPCRSRLAHSAPLLARAALCLLLVCHRCLLWSGRMMRPIRRGRQRIGAAWCGRRRPAMGLDLAQACPRCGARTRSGGRCLGMRMANGKCRMHGGASPGAPRGEGQRHVAARVAVSRGDRAAPDGDSRDAKDTAGDARACAD